MTSDPESRLFEFAGSTRTAATEDEKMVNEIHAALGIKQVPLRLTHLPVVRPSRAWRQHSPVAAAVMLLITLLGAGFSMTIPDRTEYADFASVPPVVLGLTGQASATSGAESCDFSGDVPFFSGIDTSPIDGATVLLTQNEQLIRECDGKRDVLLDGVKVAGSSMTPHGMVAITENANHLINIVTGEHIEIPNEGPNAQTSIGPQSFGPWVISASTNDMSTASVYELTSMTEIPVVTENGERVEIARLKNAVISSDQNQLAIAVPTDKDVTPGKLSGFFIADLNGKSRFVTADRLPMPRQIAISPDGQTIATSSFEGSFSEGTTTITLLGTSEGDGIIQSWELQTRDQASEITWLNDSSTLMLTDGTKLLGITPDSPQEGIQIYATGDTMQGIFLTPDERVVTITRTSTSTNPSPETQTLFVNVDSGAIVTQPGSDMWTNPNYSTKRTTLVLGQLTVTGENAANLLVVEAATGDVIGELTEDISPDRFPASTWGYGDRDIVSVAFDLDSMWLLVDEHGNSTLEQIEPPVSEVMDQEAVMLAVSPDGYMIVRTSEPFHVWLKAPNTDEWVAIDLPEPGSESSILPGIQFVIGEE